MLNELWSFLSAWYNLPYTILIALALLLAAVQLVGLGGDGGEEADANADADVEANADADMDADADADADTDADADHELQPTASGPSALGLLAFLGVGKAPLFVVLLMVFGSIGLLGWLFNALAQSALGGLAGLTVGLGAIVAVVGGSLASARLARLIGRALPPSPPPPRALMRWWAGAAR